MQALRMGWIEGRSSWCNRVARKLAWPLAASLAVCMGPSLSRAADSDASEDHVSFGSVDVAGDPQDGERQAPAAKRTRRQLDERFSMGLHDRMRSSKSREGFRENRRKELVYDDPERRFRATVHPDGRMTFRDRGLSFRNQRIMGLYDMILHAQGTELHQGQKRALLRETFEDRLAMRVDWSLDNLDQAERELWRELSIVWHDERLTLDERKRIILQRWAECDVDVDLSPLHGVSSPVDRQRRTVARRAQRAIEHFVRVHVDDKELIDHHRAMGGSKARLSSPSRAVVDPTYDLAVSLAPDVFEECERDPAACISVGDLLVGRRANAFDPARGATYYGRACDSGDPWACYELAVLHYLGLGVARDDKRSARLHGVACEGGVAEGCAYLAHLHRVGFGVVRSDEDSARYRRRACEQGLRDACAR